MDEVAEMVVDMVADMEFDMVADMEVDMVADMEVDKVADMFKTKCIKPEIFKTMRIEPTMFYAKCTWLACLKKVDGITEQRPHMIIAHGERW